MKTKWKRIISAMLIVACAFSLIATALFTSFATANENRVFAEPFTAEQGKQISVPVKIENNTGFMGFMILVEVDRSVLTPTSVSKGELLNGAFEDSISVTSSGAFRVIFSGTENVVQDGVLFVLQFDVAPDAIGESTIALTYSVPDTFNEEYKEVGFNCETLQFSLTEPITDPPINPPEGDKLSERLLAWWNNLSGFWHYVTAIVILPLAFIISKFGK